MQPNDDFTRANPNERRERVSLVDKKLLEMTAQAVAGEEAAARFYRRLSDMLGHDRQTVRGIMLDDVKHRRMCDELFQILSGGARPIIAAIPEMQTGNGKTPADILEAQVNDKLQNVEFYRGIYFALSSPELRDIVYEILTDEQRHAQLLTVLYAKHCVRM